MNTAQKRGEFPLLMKTYQKKMNGIAVIRTGLRQTDNRSPEFTASNKNCTAVKKVM